MESTKRAKCFLESVALPLHMGLIEEMPRPDYSDRFSDSTASRSTQHTCGYFYKHISRPFPLSCEEGGAEGGDERK